MLLIDSHRTGSGVVTENPGVKTSVRVSALHATGIDELKAELERGVLTSTGREVRRLVLPADGPHLRWGTGNKFHGLKPWPNGPSNSSQLEPSSQLRWSWVSFGHPLGLT